MVLPTEGNRLDRALDRGVVDLDTAVIEESAKGGPAGQRAADRFGKATAGWNAA
jgi:hypothetical protein